MDLLDLFVKIGVKDEATDKVDKIGDGVIKKVSNIGGVVKTVLTGAAAVAVVDFGKQSVGAFADFEQLIGGAELLFGDAYDFIAERARNAYSDVQMSANDYLQQVNGFAVGLKTALGGDEQAAAELSDRIIRAEADVVAATGNSQEAVQAAFNGIMKTNYTMLDNLQLGIKPTKAGMQEVIDKVNEWHEANGEASNYVIDNLADCQAALVDYIEMQGLAGYASMEAAGTITGSMSMTKSAWQNFLSAFAGGGDVSKTFNALVDSATNTVGLIVPRVQEIFSNVPVVIDAALSALVDQGGVIGNAASAIQGWMSTIREIVQSVIEAIKTFWEINGAAIIAYTEGFFDVIKTAVDTALKAVKNILDIALALIQGDWKKAWEGVKALFETVTSAIESILESFAGLITDILQRVTSFITNIWDTAWTFVKDKVSEAWENVKNTVSALYNGIVERIGEVKQVITDKIGEAVDYIKSLPQQALTWGRDLIANFIGGIKEKAAALKEELHNTADKVKDFLGFSEPEEGPLSNFHTYAPDMMQLYAQGIRDNMYLVEEALKAVPTINVNAAGEPGGSMIHNYIEIGGQPLLDFVNEGLGAMV